MSLASKRVGKKGTINFFQGEKQKPMPYAEKFPIRLMYLKLY